MYKIVHDYFHKNCFFFVLYIFIGLQQTLSIYRSYSPKKCCKRCKGQS